MQAPGAGRPSEGAGHEPWVWCAQGQERERRQARALLAEVAVSESDRKVRVQWEAGDGEPGRSRARKGLDAARRS